MLSDQIQEWLIEDESDAKTRSIENFITLGTDIGLYRNENQDRVAVLRVNSAATNNGFWCVCLCDGMGGMNNGRLAASAGLAKFFEALVQSRKLNAVERLSLAVNKANDHVREAFDGAGATLSAVLTEGRATYTVNVGDSRIYVADRNHSVDIGRLTTDDTMEEAYGSEGRGLLQHIGMAGKIIPHVNRVTVEHDADLIITSDGAHRIGIDNIKTLYRYSESATQFCQRALELARWYGGVDNATLAMITTSQSPYESNGNSSADVSIWTVGGRLKILWSISGQNSNFTSEPNHTPGPAPNTRHDRPDASKEKSPAPIPDPKDQAQPPSAAKRRKTGGNTQTRMKSKSKKDEEQIEIGFTDEDNLE